MNEQNQLITDKYKVLQKLGKGGYGIVYEVENKQTKARRACKVISKSKVNDSFEQEKELMIKADNPNIVKLYEIFQDEKFYYLVMEECTGGELFEKIIENVESKKMYTEKEAARLFRQVLMAIAYCHNMQICHRDLKPENLLFSSKSKNASLKVIDFGLAKKYERNKKMKQTVGTAFYIAPEVLQGDYNEKCDIWSAGVILYILLCGDPPFNGSNDNEIFEKVLQFKYKFSEKKWGKISEDAKDLIRKMLVPQRNRISAEEALAHPWFTKMEETNKTSPIDIDIQVFKNYVNSTKLKKTILTYIADRLDEDDIANLKDNFYKFDQNSNGTISFDEFKKGLNGKGLNKEEIETMFKFADTDGSGTLDYTEFIAATLNVKKDIKEVHLHDAFISFDLDKSGKISKEELMKILRINEGEQRAKTLQKMIDKIDVNKDGEIDYNEFMNMMYQD